MVDRNASKDVQTAEAFSQNTELLAPPFVAAANRAEQKPVYTASEPQGGGEQENISTYEYRRRRGLAPNRP